MSVLRIRVIIIGPDTADNYTGNHTSGKLAFLPWEINKKDDQFPGLVGKIDPNKPHWLELTDPKVVETPAKSDNSYISY